MKHIEPNLGDLVFSDYAAGGRGAGEYDCFGLFAEICRRRGVTVPSHPTPDDLGLREAAILDGAAQWVPLVKPEPWCGVAFRIGPFVAHMGVVLEDCEQFIHADRKIGITIDRLDSPRWARRIAGFYRAP
jgi:cell wall-associated NlpC family hydrolase